MIHQVNSTKHGAGLIMAVVLLLHFRVLQAHYMWAHVVGPSDSEHDVRPIRVDVLFSQTAGVPDGEALVNILDDYSDAVSQMTHTCCCNSYDFSLHLIDDVLEGDFFPNDPHNLMSNCSALASGHFDFGPYTPLGASDVQFTYNAQIYQAYSGFDDFFVGLMEKAKYPSIVMRNCGGNSETTSYQFAVGGFPGGKALDVCLYYQGGIKIHCGSFQVPDDSTILMESILSPSLTTSHFNDAPTLIYAKANMTVTDGPASNDNKPRLLYATTSVYFEGVCKK